MFRVVLCMGLFALFGAMGVHCVDDGGQPTSQEIGAEGGVVALPGGGTLTIPKGALTSKVKITVKPTTLRSDIQIFTAVGGALEFLPEGTEFQVPVTLRIPTTLTGEQAKDLSLAWSTETEDEWEKRPAIVENGEIIATILHFSRGVPAKFKRSACCDLRTAKRLRNIFLIERCRTLFAKARKEGFRCAKVCCFEGGSFVEVTNLVCAQKGGRMLATKVCSEEVCCDRSGEFSRVPKKECPDNTFTTPVAEIRCQKVCCLTAPLGQSPVVKIRSFGACNNFRALQTRSDPIAKEMCDEVCCDFEGLGSFPETSRFECLRKRGVPLPLERCQGPEPAPEPAPSDGGGNDGPVTPDVSVRPEPPARSDGPSTPNPDVSQGKDNAAPEPAPREAPPDPRPDLPTCKAKDASCSSDQECCQGMWCEYNTIASTQVCEPKPAQACLRYKQKCTGSSTSCCHGLVCQGIGCFGIDPGKACTRDRECSTGLCKDGKCAVVGVDGPCKGSNQCASQALKCANGRCCLRGGRQSCSSHPNSCCPGSSCGSNGFCCSLENDPCSSGFPCCPNSGLTCSGGVCRK